MLGMWCCAFCSPQDVPCLTPLPCLSGSAGLLLAPSSQRAGVPLDSSGKDVACCYEQIWNSFSTWLLIRCYSSIFFHLTYDRFFFFLVFNNFASKTWQGNSEKADLRSWTLILTTPEPHLDQTFVSIWKRLKRIWMSLQQSVLDWIFSPGLGSVLIVRLSLLYLYDATELMWKRKPFSSPALAVLWHSGELQSGRCHWLSWIFGCEIHKRQLFLQPDFMRDPVRRVVST